MDIRRVAAIAGAAAILVAACGGGTATTAPASQAPTESEAAPSEAAPSEAASDCVVGVSWNNFQQPRWAAHDQPNIKKTVEDAGGTYIDKDANLSNEQQLTDVREAVVDWQPMRDRMLRSAEEMATRPLPVIAEAEIPIPRSKIRVSGLTTTC